MAKKQKNEYLLTDQCFYEENGGGENYNPDTSRKPHAISVVDVETGTIRMIKSGSVISIVKERE